MVWTLSNGTVLFHVNPNSFAKLGGYEIGWFCVYNYISCFIFFLIEFCLHFLRVTYFVAEHWGCYGVAWSERFALAPASLIGGFHDGMLRSNFAFTKGKGKTGWCCNGGTGQLERLAQTLTGPRFRNCLRLWWRSLHYNSVKTSPYFSA